MKLSKYADKLREVLSALIIPAAIVGVLIAWWIWAGQR